MGDGEPEDAQRKANLTATARAPQQKEDEMNDADQSPAVVDQVERPVRPLTERLTMHADNKTKRVMQIDCQDAARSIDAALHEAIAAIYFDDGSEFKPALLRIVSILGGWHVSLEAK